MERLRKLSGSDHQATCVWVWNIYDDFSGQWLLQAG
jgi:hypothetical protein